MALLTVLILILLGSFHTPTVKPSLEEKTVEIFTFEAQVESGQDESEKKEGLLLDKFRVLLGLGTFHTRKPAMEYGSPAPAAAPFGMEVQAPSPAPIMQPIPLLHPHHHRTPRVSVIVPHRGVSGNEKRRARRVLVAVVVSAVGAALVILAVVFACLGKRYYRRRNRCVRTVSVLSNEGRGVRESGKDSVVSNDHNIDVFYLNALTSVLDPPSNTSSLVQNSSIGALKKEEDQDQRGGDEIVCVHEYEKPIKHGSVIGSHSSGDESFHSICESNGSNNARLSNVSMNSYIDAADGFSPLSSSFRQNSPKRPSFERQTNPPPPPPPCFVLHSSSSLGKMKAKSQSSIIQNPSSSESPGSSSRSNETPTSVIPKTPIPPRPPSNIPPPPCPPLFMKGNSPKGAPPPGPPLDFASLGKDGAPLPKLKPLHWDKVRATPDRSMVWDKLRSSSFELDEEMIESLFGYSLKSVFQTDEGKSKTPSPNKHVLEPKRLQNMTILSKALNVSAEQVCEALLQGDGLRLQQLEALAKMEPTKEEETKISNYKGNINELGSPEKLVKAMLNIPFAFQRIEAMLYRATFEDEVVHLRNSFSMLEEACKELRSSRLFLKLLEAVLKTGNRMNVGTIRGGAKAFKLDALLKLADVKGTDGKTTLLHFVVQEIIKSEGIRMADSIMGKINRNNKSRTTEEREEDYRRMGLDLVSGLSTELCNVKKTASIDLDVLATSVSNLSDGMAKLQKLVIKDLRNDTTSSNLIGAMKAFISHGETSLRDLQEREAEVLRSVKEITEYFHGEVGKDEKNPLRIFVIVRDFMAMLDLVCRELRSLKAPKTPSPLAPFH